MTRSNKFHRSATLLKGSLCILSASLLFGLLSFSICRYVRCLPSLKTAFKLLAASGFLYAAQALLYAHSVTLIPVAFSVLLLFTSPILVSLLGVLTGSERLNRGSAFLLSCAFVRLCCKHLRRPGLLGLPSRLRTFIGFSGQQG